MQGFRYVTLRKFWTSLADTRLQALSRRHDLNTLYSRTIFSGLWGPASRVIASILFYILNYIIEYKVTNYNHVILLNFNSLAVLNHIDVAAVRKVTFLLNGPQVSINWQARYN